MFLDIISIFCDKNNPEIHTAKEFGPRTALRLLPKSKARAFVDHQIPTRPSDLNKPTVGMPLHESDGIWIKNTDM
jgi:hypothetical protein